MELCYLNRHVVGYKILARAHQLIKGEEPIDVDLHASLKSMNRVDRFNGPIKFGIAPLAKGSRS